MKKKIFNILKVIVPLLLAVYLCWYFWNSFSENERVAFIDVFKESNYFILFISILIGLISHISRAIRWRYMLKPLGYEPPLLNAYNAIMIGYVANLIVPRMGEASRAAVLKGTDDVPFDKGFGTIVAERVIDFLCLAIVAGIAMLINLDNMGDLISLANDISAPKPGTEAGLPWIKIIVFGVIGVGFLGFVFLYLTKPAFKAKFLGFVKGFIIGLKTIFTMENKWAYLFHTCLIWACYVYMFWITFYAWDETSDLSPDVILSAFIAGTIGFIIMQGGIGTYQLLVASVLTFYVAPEVLVSGTVLPEFFGFATLVWATQTVLTVFLGLLALGMVQVNKKKKANLA